MNRKDEDHEVRIALLGCLACAVAGGVAYERDLVLTSTHVA